VSDKNLLRGNNRHNVTWVYAKSCWDALTRGDPVPPIPLYDVWEHEEGGARRIVDRRPIEPCKVSCNGVTVYG
jgi:hypothetical protein